MKYVVESRPDLISDLISRYPQLTSLFLQTKKNTAVLYGGALRQYFLKEKITDFDFYYFSNQAYQAAIVQIEKKNYLNKDVRLNSIKYHLKDFTVDLINLSITDIKDASQLIAEEGDFSVAKVGMWGNNFICTSYFFSDLQEKKLRYLGTTTPYDTLVKRLRKYLSYGFWIEENDLEKIKDDIFKKHQIRLN